MTTLSIDGLLCTDVGRDKTEKAIMQVEGGATVTRANITTLKDDVEREKATVGRSITLDEPTREMQREATAADHFETPHFGAVPKIQILTVKALLVDAACSTTQRRRYEMGTSTGKRAARRVIDGNEVEFGSGIVFADLGRPDADRLKIKSGLAVEIGKALRKLGLTQIEAARRMGIARPKVSGT